MVDHHCQEKETSLPVSTSFGNFGFLIRPLNALHNIPIVLWVSVDRIVDRFFVRFVGFVDRFVGFIDRFVGFVDRFVGFVDRLVGFVDGFVGFVCMLEITCTTGQVPHLTHEQTKVVGMPDSGFFLDYDAPPKPGLRTTVHGHYHDGLVWVFNQVIDVIACQPVITCH